MSSPSSPSPPSSSPHRADDGVDLEAVKARYVAFARDLVTTNAKASQYVKVVVFVLMAVISLTIVLLPVAVRLFRWWRRTEQNAPDPREAVAFAEAAVPVMAFPLMVNSMLLRPGTERAPGLFLISLDPGQGLHFMAELAERVGSGDSPEMSPADREFCRALMADEDYRVYRRRKLPASLTAGAVVYAVDLVISPLLLVGRQMSDEMPLVPCMAEPGDDGRIAQMPYWLVTGEPRPGIPESNEFVRTLDSIPRMTAMKGMVPRASRDNDDPARA